MKKHKLIFFLIIAMSFMIISCKKSTSGLGPDGIQFTVNGSTYLFHNTNGFTNSQGMDYILVRCSFPDSAILNMTLQDTISGKYDFSFNSLMLTNVNHIEFNTIKRGYSFIGNADVTIKNRRIVGTLSGTFNAGDTALAYSISNGTINCPITY